MADGEDGVDDASGGFLSCRLCGCVRVGSLMV